MDQPSFNRDAAVQEISGSEEWDFIVIGGGATGAGILLDAASRGYRTILFEQADFAQGTSSRSTKLIHGGVRYLEQGNVKLVTEALRERERLRQNAPHLVRDLSFVIPAYHWWEKFYFGLGLKLYDWLAGRQSFGRSGRLSRQEAISHVPKLQRESLTGGVLYHDGQFDDSRLVINLLQTAAEHGGVCLNYCRVEQLHKNDRGQVDGVTVVDRESNQSYDLNAKVLINATGPFSDGVRSLDQPQGEPLILPSRGIHLVVDGKFLGGESAILVPRTSDGRIIFAIPWHGYCLLGTTDVPVETAKLEPEISDEEIDFLLETASRFLDPAPTRADVLSSFAGIRPLINPKGAVKSSKISREHLIDIADSGLITIAGGKWTTYREMAEDCVDQAMKFASLPPKPCVSASLRLRGSEDFQKQSSSAQWDTFGSDRRGIDELVKMNRDWGEPLIKEHPLTKAEVIWSVREEMARTVEDLLSRRNRILLLNARLAKILAEPVAEILAEELGRDDSWIRTQVNQMEQLVSQMLPAD